MSNAVRNWDESTSAFRFAPPGIAFLGGGEEMLRIERHGFYVRGVQVEQTQDEAQKVYRAFLSWMRKQGMAV